MHSPGRRLLPLLVSLFLVSAAHAETLNVLFIGNSYTARHNLSEVVKSMAEAGNPGLIMNVSTVIYGGRRLVAHWRYHTQNYVRIQSLTREQEEASIRDLESIIKAEPDNKYAKGALSKHKGLVGNIDKERRKWDIVVLQSYRDDLEGDDSLYAQYAPKFAEEIHKIGAKVVLYETTPNTQNAKPLKESPDKEPILEKAKSIARLADKVDAVVAPMSLAAWHCQNERPDLTLRFINDAHLNQTLAYMTACSIYAAIFEKSPVGLPIDSVTDIRYFENKHKDKDRDGNPIKKVFSKKDQKDLQRLAWKAHQEFKSLRK